MEASKRYSKGSRISCSHQYVIKLRPASKIDVYLLYIYINGILYIIANYIGYNKFYMK